MRTPFLSTSAIDFERRARRHHVGRLDLDIGRGEGHHRRALRLGADQADVPDVLARLVGELARRL
mgnify:CR=1 FL=1